MLVQRSNQALPARQSWAPACVSKRCSTPSLWVRIGLRLISLFPVPVNQVAVKPQTGTICNGAASPFMLHLRHPWPRWRAVRGCSVRSRILSHHLQSRLQGGSLHHRPHGRRHRRHHTC